MTVNYYAPYGNGDNWRNITDLTDTATGKIAIIDGKRKLVVGDKIGELCLVDGKRRYWIDGTPEPPPPPPIGPNCIPTDGKIPWILQFKGVSFYYVSSGNYYAFASSGLGRAENSTSSCCTNSMGNLVRNGGATNQKSESIVVTWTSCVEPSNVRALSFRYGYLEIKNKLSFPTYEMISKSSGFEGSLNQDGTAYTYSPAGNNKIVTRTYTCDGDAPCPWGETDAYFCPITESNVPTSPTTGVPTIYAWLEPFSVTLTAVESTVSCSHVRKTLKLSYYSVATGTLLSEVTLPLP